jgi:predicted permease
MNPLRRLLVALRDWSELRRGELQEELRSHLEMAIADRVARGESAETARREALREFGNVPLIADVTRERWGWLHIEHFAQDLRYALHQLRKSPGFALTAILTLALGIGANLAVFSLIYAIMLRSLPVPHPEQIVALEMRTDGVAAYPEQTTNMYNVIAAHQKPLSGMCGMMWDGLLLTSEGDPKRFSTANMTGDCFGTLQLVPALGRLLTPADDVEGGGPDGYATVLSYDYWDVHYHRDPSVIGRKLVFQNLFSKPVSAVVVGVMPKGFHGLVPGSEASFYMPSYLEGKDNRDSGGNISMFVFGRLKPGVTREQAERQLQPAFAAWRLTLPPANRGDANTYLKHHDLGVYDARIGSSEMASQFGKALWFLQLLVGLILVAGCAYLSTLHSARIAGRRQELALRVALGASRSRIAAQLLVETLLLIASGAASGIFLGWGAARVLVTYITQGPNPTRLDLSPDAGLLGFALGVALLAALLTGLAPALRGSKADLTADLKTGKGVTGGRRSRGRLGAVMLPLQIAFSVVFVVLAGLLSASLVRVLSQNNGFRMNGTVFANTTIPTVVSEDSDRGETKLKVQIAQYQALAERLNHVPGIASASFSVVRPLGMASYMDAFRRLDENDAAPAAQMLENVVASGYFDTLGIRLLAGRDFSSADIERGQKICILSATAARQFFPHGGAVGGALRRSQGKDPILVVGVAEDTRWNDLHEEMPKMIYLPVYQSSGFLPSLQVLLRTDDTATATASLRRILREQAGAQIVELVTIRDAVNQSLGIPRLLATLSNALAGLALLLSAVAIYGLLSYSVKQRTAEIAVRMALGASRGDVLRMVGRQAAWLVLPGLAVGAAAAAGLGRLFKSLLYETSPADPMALSLSLGALLAVASVAALLPARRAASVEPMEALRAE